MGGIGSFQVWVSQLSQPLSYLEESFFLVSALEIKGMNIEDLDGSDSCSENHIIKHLPARLDKAPLGIEAFFLSVWRRLKSGAFPTVNLGTGRSESVCESQSKIVTELSCGDVVMVSLLSATGSGHCPQVVQGTVPR